MPTYEYECKHCGYRFDAFQKMSDLKLVECPKCPGKLKRLIGKGTGIVFKGEHSGGDWRSPESKEASLLQED